MDPHNESPSAFLVLGPTGGIGSASGIWGHATLARVEKGRVVVEATVAGILRDIEALRGVAVP